MQIFSHLQYLQSLPYVSTLNAFHIMQIEMPIYIVVGGVSIVHGAS